MSENASNLEIKFKLQEARFFLEQMKFNFQDRTKFRYFLDAFLASARSITHVFKSEFHGNKALLKWYQSKVEEWSNNKIMKFFKEMRNISLKEHTPNTRITAEATFSVDVVLRHTVIAKKISPNGTTEVRETPLHESTQKSKKGKQTKLARPKIVSYSFLHSFKWFDENSDVMYLCKKYLDELERFVTEVENRTELEKQPSKLTVKEA